jgi:2-polyprenyl-3-methyl-5-hydroxy-6-metoxy-1,4-benzoquinol methylase
MAEFDRVSDDFVDYYDEVRGHVRQEMVRRNLEPYLPPLPAKVIDIGGGDGRDSSWLASKGYDVTLVDPSQEMLKKAKARFADLEVQVVVAQGDTSNLPDVIEGPYDIVLSHGVLMYCLDKPEAHVRKLADLATTGGLISVLTKGFASAFLRTIQAKNTKNGVELLKTHKTINNLGIKVWAFEPKEVLNMLDCAGVELLEWRGVRISTDQDRRLVKNIHSDELKQVLGLEYELGGIPAVRCLGQMLHYIGQK